jgi:acetyltransferase-like isoleucine patch superfamily enzyme
VKLTAREVAVTIWDAYVIGDPEATATSARSLERATPGSLSWLRAGGELEGGFEGSILICAGSGGPTEPPPGGALVVCENPRMGLGYALRYIRERWVSYREPKIEEAPFFVVHPSSVIGEPGMSLEWDKRLARWFELPHIAGVRIGEDVRIDPQVTVMRGLLEDTVIGDDAKIGNHANVGHSAEVGKHCLIAPYVSIGGSARVGDRAKIWTGAKIAQGVRIGEHAVIGQCSNVRHDVAAHETWVGDPLRRIA